MTNHSERRLAELRARLQKHGKQLSPAIRDLANALINESAEPLSHQDCLASLPTYVDAEIAGIRLADQFPAVKQHLDTCAACADQYAQLLELTLAEPANQVAVANLPVPDLTFLPPAFALVDFVKHHAAQILATLAPAHVQDLPTIADVFFERVNALGGKFVLQSHSAQALGLGVGEADPALTTLAVTYATTQALASEFTAEQIESLAAQNQLHTTIEKKARTVAESIRVQPKLAKKIAEQFARAASSKPAGLGALIAQLQK